MDQNGDPQVHGYIGHTKSRNREMRNEKWEYTTSLTIWSTKSEENVVRCCHWM